MKYSEERMSSFGVAAVCVALVLLVCPGLIPQWGRWYSPHLSYRWQTEALLHGHVSLSSDPARMGWDLVWDDGGVQQVWGLAVPLCRLPFEALARLFGQRGFPDRLVFFFFLFGTAFATTRWLGALARWDQSRRPILVICSGLICTVLYPPFLALCTSRFLVYEEAIAYGYPAALLVMLWTVWLWHRPSAMSFAGLALLSALLPYFRPTLIFFGAAAVALGSMRFWTPRPRFRVLALGSSLYVLGIAVLLWSNQARFGSPVEFGHSLNLNGMSAMRYASRFGDPFRTEPFISAAKELFSLLFLVRSLVMSDCFGDGQFPGQSHTFRWREVYFSTYDLLAFTAVIISWGWTARRLYLWFKNGRRFDQISSMELIGLWSILGTVPLLVLYLRFAFVSSRYMMDLAPGFAAACLVSVQLLFRRAERWKPATAPLLGIGCVMAVWGYEMLTKIPQTASAWSWAQVAQRLEADAENATSGYLPSAYTNGFPMSDLKIPFNGAGWDSETGVAQSSVALYVSDPTSLIVDVAPGDAVTNFSTNDYSVIQAKIGLEFLKRQSMKPIPGGMRIIFDGPQRPRYQKGVQVVFLGMIRPSELSLNDSKFRLLRVSWGRN